MTFLKLDEHFKYPEYEVCVDAKEQATKLSCCNIAPDVYGDYADVTHFAVETILAAKRGGASINGSVHVSQDFEVRAPVKLGETLTLRGEVTSVEPVPKGDMVACRFEFVRPNGDVPLVLGRTSLRADPSRMHAPKNTQRRAKTSPEPSNLQLASSHQLEPEKVARYSDEADNLIHSDPAVAKQFGFEKPIAGGLMAVRYMMSHLWRNGPVASLNMSVRFMRPMFWDDELKLHVSEAPAQQLVMLRGRDGKAANQAVVREVTYV
jgi:acyl dehydratase